MHARPATSAAPVSATARRAPKARHAMTGTRARPPTSATARFAAAPSGPMAHRATTVATVRPSIRAAVDSAPARRAPTSPRCARRSCRELAFTPPLVARAQPRWLRFRGPIDSPTTISPSWFRVADRAAVSSARARNFRLEARARRIVRGPKHSRNGGRGISAATDDGREPRRACTGSG